jgi:tryptophan halogenase
MVSEMNHPATTGRVLILGGGSAGLLAALTLKRMIPSLEVVMTRSTEIGVIGVGEGTTAVFPQHLFGTLGIPQERFYREAEPTWKQGIRFLWGERGDYFYDFGFQYDAKFPGMEKPTGFYADADCHDLNLTCAMMRRGKAFASGPLGRPVLAGEYAFHIENAKLVGCLENIAVESGVEIIDDIYESATRNERGIASLRFKSGRELTADWYVDASGFRAELIGGVLDEPFRSFSGGLFCDRAVAGGWERDDEHLQAYTTAETYDHGWCWQIEHEHHINRGYVFGSAFLDDDQAEAEFRRLNPKVANTRVVRFRSGRRERNWAGNVIAIGNASGFVEPLEATALAQIIYASGWLAQTLMETRGAPDDAARDRYNFAMARAWDEIRDFLALHYKFNTLRDTPFWRHCREATSLGDYQGFYEAYREIGPDTALIHHLPYRPNIYGIEGYLAHLVGMRVPFRKRHKPSVAERGKWRNHRDRIAGRAAAALTVRQTLDAIRRDDWQFAPLLQK